MAPAFYKNSLLKAHQSVSKPPRMRLFYYTILFGACQLFF
ncbi:hypothetical protein RUMCAL_02312 [Ruminococcus callidus ATCC 27760]|uniref:Uncharacterized protein n=1 Tax=Ruminococcus callidus ATCC 27760 TaxID=411473 RepID=U2M190_9FIRM|nr:hypothetical protein RUMCAL_02312 [Ruminococcus callidus ATCC 27760]